jgi:DNA replication protein DnaC
MITTAQEIALKLRERMATRVHGAPQRPTSPDSEAFAGCPRCGGWGWRQSRQYQTWFLCECVSANRRAMLAEQSKPDYSRMGMKEDELGLDWSAIKPGISDGKVGMDAVRPKYMQGYGMVFLWGTWGQGKTLIGKILTASALRDGKTAAYANMSAVLDDIRLAFDSQERKTTELIRRMDWWTSRDVLFLDELDKCNSTEWAKERMFELLDQRYTRAIREEALTVVASNSKVDELDEYLQSRLKDRRLGPVVYMHGKDARQVMPEGYRF